MPLKLEWQQLLFKRGAKQNEKAKTSIHPTSGMNCSPPLCLVLPDHQRDEFSIRWNETGEKNRILTNGNSQMMTTTHRFALPTFPCPCPYNYGLWDLWHG